MSQVDSEVQVGWKVGGGAVELNATVVVGTTVVAGAMVVGTTVVVGAIVIGAVVVVGTAVGAVPTRFVPLPHADATTMNASPVVKPVFIVEHSASREVSMSDCRAVVSNPSHAAL
jgi:hypothetical protein